MAPHDRLEDNMLYSLLLDFVDNKHLLRVAALVVAVWGVVWMGLGFFQPAWFRRLHSSHIKRLFLVGSMISLGFRFVTIPSCALAVWMTPPEDDVAGVHPPMNIYQQTCWGSRGTVTILEIVHFSQNHELMLHHVLLLLVMSVIGIFNYPHRGFDLALGALLSEIPNSCFTVLKGFDLAGEYPVLALALPLCSAMLALIFRVPAIFVTMAMAPSSGQRGGTAVVTWIACLFYLAYVVHMACRGLRRAKVWLTEDGGGFRLRINEHCLVSSTSLYTGLVVLCSQASALALYSFVKTEPAPATTSELVGITWHSLPAGLVGLSLSHCVAVRVSRLLDHRWGLVTRVLTGTFTAVTWLCWTAGSRSAVDISVLAGCSVLGVFFTTALAQILARVKMPGLAVMGRWVIAAWVLYVGVLARVGGMPESQNKDMSVAQIVAGQPPICGLLLTWSFWCASALSFVLSLSVAHVLHDREGEGSSSSSSSPLHRHVRQKPSPSVRLGSLKGALGDSKGSERHQAYKHVHDTLQDRPDHRQLLLALD